MAAAMDIDNSEDIDDSPSVSGERGSKKRFEVKKVSSHCSFIFFFLFF